MGLLSAEKTADFVIGHPIDLVRDGWDCLNEANHCFVAFRVEFVVITSL
jgi:hypothetical protein